MAGGLDNCVVLGLIIESSCKNRMLKMCWYSDLAGRRRTLELNFKSWSEVINLKSTVPLHHPTSSSQWRNYHRTTSAVSSIHSLRCPARLWHWPSSYWHQHTPLTAKVRHVQQPRSVLSKL